MITDQIIRSFLTCPYKSYLQAHEKFGEKTPFELLEEHLLQSAKSQYLKELPSKVSNSQIVTKIPLEKKYTLVGNAYLIHPVFQSQDATISFDAIEITPHKDFPDTFSYVPIEILGKETVQRVEKLTLTMKLLLLLKMEKIPIEFGKVVYGSDSKTTKVIFSDYIKEARKTLKGLMQTLGSQESPRFYWTKYCTVCEFCRMCYTVLKEKDDLSLLAGMSAKEIAKQNNKEYDLAIM